MNVIQFSQVTKSFFLQQERTFKDVLPALFLGKSWATPFQALSDVSFDIAQGETVGIVGKNGSGKSTLLKLIAGVTYPSKGNVTVSQQVAPLIELGAGFHHELTGYENIFLNAAILGMHKKEIQSKVDEIIAFSELEEFIHTPVKRYSSGMYMRLGFAVAVNTLAPILLIDEVLAVGDEAFQKKCLIKLQELKKQNNRTIVFVSHDEKSVRSFCDRVILLDHGKLIHDGTPAESFVQYHKLSGEV